MLCNLVAIVMIARDLELFGVDHLIENVDGTFPDENRFTAQIIVQGRNIGRSLIKMNILKST